jgi:hypothetical protein
VGQLERLFREHQRSSGATLWDVYIDAQIPSPQHHRVDPRGRA